MFESIKRFFAHWHRVPRHKVPRWVRGKLYKQSYVVDRGREYKKNVIRRTKSYYVDDGEHNLVEKIKRWKKQKFYYRNIK